MFVFSTCLQFSAGSPPPDRCLSVLLWAEGIRWAPGAVPSSCLDECFVLHKRIQAAGDLQRHDAKSKTRGQRTMVDQKLVVIYSILSL